MYECLKNFNCIKEWVLSNLLWAIISGTVILVLFKFLPKLFQAIKITKTILKANRDTRDNGLGKYSADRFFDIWYSQEKLPLRRGGNEFYAKRFGLNSRHWLSAIDSELENMKLIESFDANLGFKAVRPIKNFRNKLVARMTRFYLIHFIGDNPHYYKNMEEQSKK